MPLLRLLGDGRRQFDLKSVLNAIDCAIGNLVAHFVVNLA